MRKPLIHIDTIENSSQRYKTWEDWEIPSPGEKLTVSVSRVGNWRYEYLAGIHGLLEAVVCLHQGITQADVDAFDVAYEHRRMAGEVHAACGCVITDDPGSDVHAPYRLAHVYAESVEYG